MSQNPPRSYEEYYLLHGSQKESVLQKKEEIFQAHPCVDYNFRREKKNSDHLHYESLHFVFVVGSSYQDQT